MVQSFCIFQYTEQRKVNIYWTIPDNDAIFSVERLKARIKEIKPRWETDLKPLTKMLPSYEEAAKIVLQAFV